MHSMQVLGNRCMHAHVHACMIERQASDQADLHFSFLCASICETKTHDGSYPYAVVSMVH